MAKNKRSDNTSVRRVNAKLAFAQTSNTDLAAPTGPASRFVCVVDNFGDKDVKGVWLGSLHEGEDRRYEVGFEDGESRFYTPEEDVFIVKKKKVNMSCMFEILTKFWKFAVDQNVQLEKENEVLRKAARAERRARTKAPGETKALAQLAQTPDDLPVHSPGSPVHNPGSPVHNPGSPVHNPEETELDISTPNNPICPPPARGTSPKPQDPSRVNPIPVLPQPNTPLYVGLDGLITLLNEDVNKMDDQNGPIPEAGITLPPPRDLLQLKPARVSPRFSNQNFQQDE